MSDDNQDKKDLLNQIDDLEQKMKARAEGPIWDRPVTKTQAYIAFALVVALVAGGSSLIMKYQFDQLEKDLDQMIEDLSQTTENLAEATDNFTNTNESIDGLLAQIESSTANIETVTAQLAPPRPVVENIAAFNYAAESCGLTAVETIEVPGAEIMIRDIGELQGMPMRAIGKVVTVDWNGTLLGASIAFHSPRGDDINNSVTINSYHPAPQDIPEGEIIGQIDFDFVDNRQFGRVGEVMAYNVPEDQGRYALQADWAKAAMHTVEHVFTQCMNISYMDFDENDPATEMARNIFTERPADAAVHVGPPPALAR